MTKQKTQKKQEKYFLINALSKTMAQKLQQLIDLLDLEQVEVNLFRGHSPDDSWQRVFGGQVIGQALVAASRTVEDVVCHSLHAYFLRPGDPSIPIVYEVDRARDGKAHKIPRG